MLNPSFFFFLEGQLWYFFTYSLEDKGVHTFPKDICPKMSVIARLEFELAYYDFAVKGFNNYASRITPPEKKRANSKGHP